MIQSLGGEPLRRDFAPEEETEPKVMHDAEPDILELIDAAVNGLAAASTVLLRSRKAIERERHMRKTLAENTAHAGNVIERSRQVANDQHKNAIGKGNLQLFCPQCSVGVGDESGLADGIFSKCFRCGSEGPWLYSWEVSDWAKENQQDG